MSSRQPSRPAPTFPESRQVRTRFSTGAVSSARCDGAPGYSARLTAHHRRHSAFFYRDAQMHRLGSANIHQIPFRCPSALRIDC